MANIEHPEALAKTGGFKGGSKGKHGGNDQGRPGRTVEGFHDAKNVHGHSGS